MNLHVWLNLEELPGELAKMKPKCLNEGIYFQLLHENENWSSHTFLRICRNRDDQHYPSIDIQLQDSTAHIYLANHIYSFQSTHMAIFFYPHNS